mmetsp:Transcript_14078/g.19774  ORF Transcript_14078/g.19774 Transcript_14078/m.19774 type:complete len:465 (+) Transcript_14078:86-1480(+)
MKLSIVTLAGLLVSAASFTAPSQQCAFQTRKLTTVPKNGVRITRRSLALKQSLQFNDDIDFIVTSMLKNSQFVYNFANLRALVREHDRLIRDGEPAKEKVAFFFEKEKPLVDFYRPELIVTQRGAQDDSMNRYFKYPITSASVLEFIQNNRKLLDDSEGDVKLGDNPNETPLKMEELLEQQARYDGEMIDYDDQFTDKEGLVYALTVNRSRKRITAIFRGTVGLKDIKTDANFFHTTPDLLKNCGLDGKEIRTHKGFSSYLFNDIPEEERESPNPRSKFERMVAAIKEIYDDLDVSEEEKGNYELVVTGHSLGGGLANLFAYAVAKTQNDYKFFDRVTAVTFAAPVVGDKEYNKSFQDLESKGILRHIRVSNEGDVVPTQPVPGYTQNGVNLHFYADKPVDVDYRNSKVLRPWWLLDWFGTSVLDKHMFEEYERRKDLAKNDAALQKSLNQIYEEEAVAKGFSG